MFPRALGMSLICLSVIACADGLDNPHRATSSSLTSPTTASADPVANYAGAWSGTYTVLGCTQSGGVSLANPCSSIGSVAPYTFSFTQGGPNVTGFFTLGSVTFPNTGGTVAKDGSLALSATSLTSDGTTAIVNWALQSSGSTILGTVTVNERSSTLSGSAVIAGAINSAIHAN